MAQNDEPALRLVDVQVKRGSTLALRDVSLSLDGGVVALIGPNGSGKSTLLRAVAGLSPVAGGSVVVVGDDMRSRQRQAQRHLGFLPQAPHFPDTFTCEEAIRYAAWLHRVEAAQVDAQVRRVLDSFGLDEIRGSALSKLSGGMRQRVYLAQALVHRPRVVLMDEPTVGVDVEQRAAMRDFVREIGRESLVLFSTHITEDIEFLADHVVALRAGRLVWQGTRDELAASAPREPGRSTMESVMRRLGGGEAA